MSYSDLLAAAFGRRPFRLFAFRRNGIEYLFTDRKGGLTKTVAGVAGTSWAESSLTTGRIPDAGKAAKSEFRIVLPLSDAFATLFLTPSWSRTAVQVWRGFSNDVDGEVISQFKGQVVSSAPQQEGTMTVVCMTDMAALEAVGLSAVIQRPCRHVLYGRGCGLALADWQTSLEVSGISMDGRAVEVVYGAGSTGPSVEDDYYLGGLLEYGGAFYWITDQADGLLTLEAPARGLLADIEALGTGDPIPTVKVAPGCPLTKSICAARFDNLLNFGGFPYITDTPFDGRSIV